MTSGPKGGNIYWRFKKEAVDPVDEVATGSNKKEAKPLMKHNVVPNEEAEEPKQEAEEPIQEAEEPNQEAEEPNQEAEEPNREADDAEEADGAEEEDTKQEVAEEEDTEEEEDAEEAEYAERRHVLGQTNPCNVGAKTVQKWNYLQYTNHHIL